jgi:UDP-N-acetyl-alpha-D-muramoyl-L-alanyl-L-glutamate epimerase
VETDSLPSDSFDPDALHSRFDPRAIERFRFASRDFDETTGTATFTYCLDDAAGTVVTCRERFVFPRPTVPLTAQRRAVLDRLLGHLGMVAGLSYFKLAAPPAVQIDDAAQPDGWSLEDIEFHRTVLAKGLGEYSFMNGLPAELSPTFSYRSVAAGPTPITGLHLNNGPLVPVGGGKDSCVSIEALRIAGIEPTLITVNRYPVIQEVITDAVLPDLAVKRILDPKLRVLNEAGARNGHVPATAIVSFAVLCAAVIHGHDAVVMSNERSASEGNVEYLGVSINHQWSKSHEAEELIRARINSITPELTYFSLLRPLSELSIAQRFAATCARYFDSFSSCNAAFRLDPARRVSRWCGHCPKCQFVYLALATSLPRETVERIWGAELFSSSPLDGFRALLGLTDWKPFECVGESGECAVALAMLSEREEWRNHPVIVELVEQVKAAGRYPSDAERAAVFASDLAYVPERYAHVLSGASVDVVNG